MPVVCAPRFKADELAAIEVFVLDGLVSIVAPAEGLLIRLRVNKTVKASKVRIKNSFFALAFFMCSTLSQIKRRLIR